jgi:hypothetical protein
MVPAVRSAALVAVCAVCAAAPAVALAQGPSPTPGSLPPLSGTPPQPLGTPTPTPTPSPTPTPTPEPAATAASSGSGLPRTGSDAALVAAIGLGFVATGAALRRAVREPAG